MIKPKSIIFILVILSLLLLAACGGETEMTPTVLHPTDVAAVAEEPLVAVTLETVEEPTEAPEQTAVPEPTVEPTEEPEPTAEPTPEPEPVVPTEGPDLITVAQPNLFPEGIEYDVVNGRFLLSSIGEGTIYAVADDGSFQSFIEDSALLSTIGLEMDMERNRLLVANTAYIFTDSSLASESYLGIYDLTTGERLEMIDLLANAPGGDHFANDIAVDAEGNAYVTDSLGGVFKVDTAGNVSSFVGGAEGIVAPNGIVYHPDGYLLITNTAEGSLYKVPVDAPGSASRVEMDQPIFCDGMVWHPNGNLVVVEYRSGSILALASEDDWKTAEFTATSPEHPASTIAVRGEQIYAIYPHFDKLFSGDSPDAFEIILVEFID